LYFEPQFNAPAVPDVEFFTTSFGVQFGMMVCFDLMFPHPQVDLYNEGINSIFFRIDVHLTWKRYCVFIMVG
jgi:hypothetical protein